jgi:Domain of unknown function (DUF1906)
MTYKVVTAQPGTLIADTFTPMPRAGADALFTSGFRALLRYTENITPEELANCTAAGLGVAFITEGLAISTTPTAALGTSMAQGACARIAELGVPARFTLFSDLEGQGRQPADWLAYANAHADGVVAEGGIAGGYFGFGVGLTGAEMFGIQKMTRYGKGASRLTDRFGDAGVAEPLCGWCWTQGLPLDMLRPPAGRIDVGFLANDYLGRAVTLVVAA